VQFIMDDDQPDPLQGPVNLASPHPVTNHDFMRSFRRACHKRLGFPATRWMLEIGAFFLRTETELLLKSRQVVPGRLLASGFGFEFPDLGPALEDILRSMRGT
jgi:NAD dependent epimerase/dehydratase family enzyme